MSRTLPIDQKYFRECIRCKCKDRLKVLSCSHKYCRDCFNNILIGADGDNIKNALECPMCKEKNLQESSSENTSSSEDSSTTPEKEESPQCASCTGREADFLFYYTKTYNILNFYHNKAHEKLNLPIGINLPNCDKCLLLEPVTLEIYYEHGNLVQLKLYEEIQINLKDLLPELTNYDNVVLKLKAGIDGIETIIKYIQSFTSQSFTIYTLVLDHCNRTHERLVREIMDGFIRLESISRKIRQAYNFIFEILERKNCPTEVFQIILKTHTFILADSIMLINETFLKEFEVNVDNFARAIQVALGTLDLNGFRKKNPEAFAALSNAVEEDAVSPLFTKEMYSIMTDLQNTHFY